MKGCTNIINLLSYCYDDQDKIVKILTKSSENEPFVYFKNPNTIKKEKKEKRTVTYLD